MAQTGEAIKKLSPRQINRTKVVAHSSETLVTHQLNTVAFTDTSKPHEQNKDEQDISSGVTLLTKGQEVTMDNYFKRTYMYTMYTWSASDAVGTQKFMIEIPLDIMNNNSTLENKTDEIAYWAPDIEFEIQLNATAFHYGRLVFAVQYQGNYLANANLEYTNATTWSEWYQLSAGANQSLKFTVPYKNFVSRIPTSGNAAFFLTKYTIIRGWVALPLLSAASATPADVSFTVWYRFVNPRLQGYSTIPVAQSGELMDLVTTGMSALAVPSDVNLSFAANLNANRANSKAVDGKVYKYGAGNSTPVNPAMTNSMQIRQPIFAKAEDVPNSVLLAPAMTAYGSNDPQLVNDTMDHHSIQKYVSHMSLLYQEKIDSTTATDAVVWNMALCPRSFERTGLGTKAYTKCRWPLRPYVVGSMFTHWRGGMKFHISFVCSAFHSARLRFVWNPNGFHGENATYPRADQSNVYSVVMDINKQTDFSIRIPWFHFNDWARNDPGRGGEAVNGTVQLILINKLTSAISPIQPIYYQIFASMDDDAQFANPTLWRNNVWGNPDYSPTAPASINALKRDEDEVVAQSGETLECEIPVSSAACANKAVFRDITGIENVQTTQFRSTMNYEFNSFKQLSNMLTPTTIAVTTAAQTYYNFEVDPFGALDVGWQDSEWGNYYARVRSLFAFGRGSLRVLVTTNEKNIQACAYLTPVTGQKNKMVIESDGNFPFIESSQTKYVSGGSIYTQDVANMPLDITMPYMLAAPCQPLVYRRDRDLLGLNRSIVTMCISTQKTEKKLMLHLATGDDFMFGVPIAIPPYHYE